MKLSLEKGTIDQSVYIFIQDNTVSTGAGKTGIAYNTASLSCYYVREGGTATQITLASQTVDGAHTDGGFVEVDATNMPGLYRLDLPDAVCATGADNVIVSVQGRQGARLSCLKFNWQVSRLLPLRRHPTLKVQRPLSPQRRHLISDRISAGRNRAAGLFSGIKKCLTRVCLVIQSASGMPAITQPSPRQNTLTITPELSM